MKLYADTPARRSVQIVTDLLFLGWVVVWIWVGQVVRDGTLELAGPGRQIASSATSLAEGLSDAGARLDDVPLIGEGVAVPFDKAAGGSSALAEAGQAQVHAVESLAFWLGLSVMLIPILVVAAFYLPGRIRFIREATAGSRFIDATADLDLFALRALSRQPMYVLARVHDDPAGAWRARNPDVIAALADLELRACGLRARAPLSAGPGTG
jgi:hypothetical protein